MSYTIFWIITVIAVVLALIAWYEYQLAQAMAQLDALLDRLEELTDLANEPPFNLQLDDPVLVEAFKLRSVPAFTQAEIEHWN